MNTFKVNASHLSYHLISTDENLSLDEKVVALYIFMEGQSSDIEEMAKKVYLSVETTTHILKSLLQKKCYIGDNLRIITALKFREVVLIAPCFRLLYISDSVRLLKFRTG